MTDLPILAAFPPRVYGRVTEPEREKLRRRSGSQAELVKAWFLTHPGQGISADRLAAVLGLPCERGIACRLSELHADGWLIKGARVPGPRGISVSEYRRAV